MPSASNGPDHPFEISPSDASDLDRIRAALRQADGALDRFDLVFGRLIDGQAYNASGRRLKFLAV